MEHIVGGIAFCERLPRKTVLGASALVLWAVLFLVLPENLPFNNDQNVYLGGAAALSAGHGYRFEQYSNLPRIGMYPPGYPFWLALFWENGQPVAVNSYRLEVANVIAAGAALLALAAWLSISELSLLAATALLLLVGTSLIFTQLTTWLMADVLFAAGSYALALLVSAYRPDRRLPVWWLAAGVLTGTLYLVKTAAVAYIVGLAAFGIVKGVFRRRPSCLANFALPTCSVIAIWFWLARGIPTYATDFSLRISRLGGMAGYFLETIKQAMLYCSGRWLVELMLNVPDRLSQARAFLRVSFLAEMPALVLGLAFAVVIFLGIKRGPKDARDEITLFLLGATGLQLFLWPAYLGARGGLALVPFLAMWLWRGLPTKAARAVLVAVLAVNIPGNTWLSYKTIRSAEKEGSQSLQALQQAARWINEAGGTDASVAAGRDVPLTHFFEYLGRRVLANASQSSEGKNLDVNPSSQENKRADYWITGSPRGAAYADRTGYRFLCVFGKWKIFSLRN
jgi:hypothetical protein